MARRKRKVFYQITTFTGLLWDGRKWVTYENRDRKGCHRSHRRIRNGNKAWNAFFLMPSGAILLKWFYRDGKRYCAEYVKK